MRLHSNPRDPESRCWTPECMREELSHALIEALYEIEVLPENTEGAVVGLYAIMDDLQEAIRRTQKLDLLRTA